MPLASAELPALFQKQPDEFCKVLIFAVSHCHCQYGWFGPGRIVLPRPYPLRFLGCGGLSHDMLGSGSEAIGRDFSSASAGFGGVNATEGARCHRGGWGRCGLLRHDSNLLISCHVGNDSHPRSNLNFGRPRAAS